MQCNVMLMQCNVMQCAMQCDAIQCNAVQCNAIRFQNLKYFDYCSFQHKVSTCTTWHVSLNTRRSLIVPAIITIKVILSRPKSSKIRPDGNFGIINLWRQCLWSILDACSFKIILNRLRKNKTKQNKKKKTLFSENVYKWEPFLHVNNNFCKHYLHHVCTQLFLRLATLSSAKFFNSTLIL